MAFNPVFKDLVVLKTKNFVVGQDWEVPISGFFVVAPKRKIKSVIDLTEEESVEFIKIVRTVRRGMQEVLKINKVYLFQGEGSRFGFHFWMFPYHRWMKGKEKFGDDVNLIIPLMRYAKKNMMDEKTISKVKKSAEKIKIYLGNKF